MGLQTDPAAPIPGFTSAQSELNCQNVATAVMPGENDPAGRSGRAGIGPLSISKPPIRCAGLFPANPTRPWPFSLNVAITGRCPKD